MPGRGKGPSWDNLMFKDFLYMFFMFSAVLQGPESVCRYRSVCMCWLFGKLKIRIRYSLA